MAHSPQAKKRVRQDEKKRVLNKGIKSTLKTQLKKVKKAVEARNVDTAKSEYVKLQTLVDRAGDKNIIHKNKAARIKSRIGKLVKTASTAVPEGN